MTEVEFEEWLYGPEYHLLNCPHREGLVENTDGICSEFDDCYRYAYRQIKTIDERTLETQIKNLKIKMDYLTERLNILERMMFDD